MNDIEKLKSLVNSDLIIPRCSKSTSKLSETIHTNSGKRQNYEILIDKVPETSLIIKCDVFPPMDCFISAPGMNDKADYIALHNKDETTYISFIEITKEKNKGVKKFTQQLLGAKSAICYCKALLQSFKNDMIFLSNVDYSFVTITRAGRTKKTTAYPNIRGNTGRDPKTPINLLNPDKIYFNMLFNASFSSRKNRQ